MSADLQLVQQKLESFRKNIEKFQYQIAMSGTVCLVQQKILSRSIRQNQINVDKITVQEGIRSVNIEIQIGKVLEIREYDSLDVIQGVLKSILLVDYDQQYKNYTDTLESLKHHIQQEQKELEMQYTVAYERRQTQIEQNYQQKSQRRNNQVEDDDEDQDEPTMENLQELDVHPDVEHNLMLIQEKNDEIAGILDICMQEIQQEVEATYKIMGDVAKMVFDQGKELDKAENNINQSNQNVKEAVKELDGAQVEHKAYLKKMAGAFFCIVLIVLIILLVVL